MRRASPASQSCTACHRGQGELLPTPLFVTYCSNSRFTWAGLLGSGTYGSGRPSGSRGGHFEPIRVCADSYGRPARGLQDRLELGESEASRPSRASLVPYARQPPSAASRSATPMADGDIGWHSAALAELGSPFRNGLQRSVNRKVQDSSPCPGANSLC